MTHQIALAFEDGITRFIECDEDQTVADAAYRARINIPFDCRDGACGTCKAFCEAGDYEDGEYIEDALSDAEAAEGYCLPCQMTPLTDLVLQVATTSEQAKTGASTVTGTITDITRHSESTVGFSVELEDRSQLAYLPGQYMNITVPGTDQTRSYSFSSGPSEDTVSFLVKLTRGGLMTGYLEERAKVGDKLAMTGPMGSFFLREPLAPILLLAGGTGLAPVLSILEKLTEDELLDVPVRLIYGATFDMDLVKLDVLDSFRDRLPDFDYFTVVSDPESDHERKGYVTQHMTDEHLHDGEADVYLCGPPPMVEAVRVFLSERPNPPANFYYEKFSSAAGPAGAGSAAVEVTSSSSGEGDAARDEGLDPSVQIEGWISLKTESNRTLAIVPAVGIPTADRINEVFEAITNPTVETREIWVIYDNRGVLRTWLSHLDWLDSYLPIRAVQMSKAPQLLKELTA